MAYTLSALMLVQFTKINVSSIFILFYVLIMFIRLFVILTQSFLCVCLLYKEFYCIVTIYYFRMPNNIWQGDC